MRRRLSLTVLWLFFIVAGSVGNAMNCSLNNVMWLIAAAIALLLGAIALAVFWIAAGPLYVAAVFVAIVSFFLIPAIKNALLEYAACRGPSKCTITNGVNNLGKIGLYLSVGTFLLAAILETAALAFLYSWFLAWIGIGIQSAVITLVASGSTACAITVIILIGVISDAIGFRDCVDAETGGSGAPPAKPMA
jgi:hypothetical protein